MAPHRRPCSVPTRRPTCFFLLPATATQTEPAQHMGATLVTNQFDTDAKRGVIVGDPSLNGLSFSAYWTVGGQSGARARFFLLLTRLMMELPSLALPCPALNQLLRHPWPPAPAAGAH